MANNKPCWEYPHHWRQVAESIATTGTIGPESVVLLEERDRALEDRICSASAGLCDSFRTTGGQNCEGTITSGSALFLEGMDWVQGSASSSSGVITPGAVGPWQINAGFAISTSGVDMQATLSVRCGSDSVDIVSGIPVLWQFGGYRLSLAGATLLLCTATDPVEMVLTWTGADTPTCMIFTQFSGSHYCAVPAS